MTISESLKAYVKALECYEGGTIASSQCSPPLRVKHVRDIAAEYDAILADLDWLARNKTSVMYDRDQQKWTINWGSLIGVDMFDTSREAIRAARLANEGNKC